MLKETAERLKVCLRKSDTIARPGRDEFIILLPEIALAGDTIIVIEKLTDILEKPFLIEGHEIFINARIGISLYPDDGLDADAMLTHSYTAMNAAKEEGSNYKFFSHAMDIKAIERLAMENSLRHALERNEFVLHYQPQVDLKTKQIGGMEALIRWQQPELGLVPPSKFIPVAEDTGLIVPIGEWVLYTACGQQKSWQKAGVAPERVAVNISARQFRERDIIETVEKVLKETSLEPSGLELELTESKAHC